MSGEHNFEAFAKMYHNDKLAEIAECHKATIYAYKKGKPIPSDIVIRIADHYKVSTDKVLGRVLPAEALTKENFPNARPNVAFTVSETQLDHAKVNQTLQDKISSQQKYIEALKIDLNDVVTERDNVAADRERIYQENKTLHERLNRLISTTEETPNTTTTVTNALEKSELGRLRAILQSIHFLSEEK